MMRQLRNLVDCEIRPGKASLAYTRSNPNKADVCDQCAASWCTRKCRVYAVSMYEYRCMYARNVLQVEAQEENGKCVRGEDVHRQKYARNCCKFTSQIYISGERPETFIIAHRQDTPR